MIFVSFIGFVYGLSVTICLLLCWLSIAIKYAEWTNHDDLSLRRRIVYLIIPCAIVTLAVTWVLAWNYSVIWMGWLVVWGLIWVGPVALGLFMVLAEAMNEY